MYLNWNYVLWLSKDKMNICLKNSKLKNKKMYFLINIVLIIIKYSF